MNGSMNEITYKPVNLLFVISGFFVQRCTCGNCQVMDTVAECVCCREIDRVSDIYFLVVAEGEAVQPPACIT